MIDYPEEIIAESLKLEGHTRQDVLDEAITIFLETSPTEEKVLIPTKRIKKNGEPVMRSVMRRVYKRGFAVGLPSEHAEMLSLVRHTAKEGTPISISIRGLCSMSRGLQKYILEEYMPEYVDQLHIELNYCSTKDSPIQEIRARYTAHNGAHVVVKSK